LKKRGVLYSVGYFIPIIGIKEKEHGVYFLEKIKNSRLLPFFENYFPREAGKALII
jgi:hypothetical protein